VGKSSRSAAESIAASVRRPIVSVVTPSLNQGRFLGDALDSVISQRCSVVEHIVVEGGSTDETASVLERYARWSHIRVVEDVPPRGQSAAINVGFRAARGEIVGWLNADDRYCDGAIAAVVEALEDGEAAVSYGDWQVIDANGVVIRSLTAGVFDRRELLEGVSTLMQPTVFYRRELFDRVGYLDESLDYAMDNDFWLRASAATEFRYVTRTIAQFRLHSESKTVRQSGRFYSERRRIARAHGGPFFSRGLRRHWLELVLGRRAARHVVWHLTRGANADAGRGATRGDTGEPKCPLCRRGLLGGRP
jgi:glycosyltransferase involved in cell wall biosynthesis